MIIYIILIIVILNIAYKKEAFCEDIEKLKKNNLYEVPLVTPYKYDEVYTKDIKNEFLLYKEDLQNYFKNLKKC